MHLTDADNAQAEGSRTGSGDRTAAHDTGFLEFFYSTPQPMWIFDVEDQRFLAVNDAACNRYGYSEHEFLKLTLREIRPAEDISMFEERLAFVGADADSSRLPTLWRHLTKDGRLLYIEIHASSIVFQGRQAVLSVLRDVSKEHALVAEREALFRLSEDLMLISTRDGRLIGANPAVQEVFGWSTPEDAPEDWLTQLHPGHLSGEDVKATCLRLTAGSAQWDAEVPTSQGIRKSIHWSCTVDLEGGRAYFIGRDLSASQQLVERLRKSEQNLARAQSIARCGSWSYDVASGSFSLSDEYYRIVGYEPGGFEPTWENCARFVHPEDRALVLSENFVEHPPLHPVEKEVRLRRPDGEVRFVRSRTFATLGSEGAPISIDGTIEDVTESRHAEREYSSVLAGARCAVWQAEVTDSNGISDWKFKFRDREAAREFLGIEIPDGMDDGDAFYDAKLAPDRDNLRASSTAELYAGLSHYQQEFRIRTVSGDIRWISEDVTIDRIEEGRWKVVGVCSDISGLKRAQEEAAQVLSRARCLLWQAGVRETDDGLAWDLEFRNPEAASRFLGIEVPPGSDFTDSFNAARELNTQVDALNIRSTNAILDGKPGYQQEFALKTKYGLRWLAEDVSIEKTGPGTWRLTGVCTDVTARKDAEEMMARAQAELENRVHDRTRDLRAANVALQEEIAERVRAQEEAERANGAKSEFLSRMSHELRTPLNAILGFGQILERQNLSEIGQESIQHILSGGRHLLSLINEILDLSRVDTGRITVSLEQLSLHEAVTEACDLIRSLAQEQGIRLIVKEESLRNQWALADKQRLKQVLLNLVSNGIKYNRPNGTVEVFCMSPGNGRVHLRVRDTGKGIGEEEMPKLFTPFERLDAAHLGIEGTGLGLALSRRLVSLMGGQIFVESSVGVGTTFAVDLEAVTPLFDGSLDLSASASLIHDDAVPARSILCVEDNLSNLRLIEMILGGFSGVKLHSAMQGSVGLDLARRLQPDLILLDLNLPDAFGLDVLKQLREHFATENIPVLVISADATSRQAEKALALGARAYLTKPLDMDEFLDAIKSALEI